MATSPMYTGGTPYGPGSPTVAWKGQVPVDVGYDVTHPGSGWDQRKAQAMQAANGQLHDGTYYVPLLITDVRIDIALGGSTAQSQYKRDFYARSFTQPSFIIEGVSLDQKDYGVICEFVHQAQTKSLFASGGTPALTQLLIYGTKWPSNTGPIYTNNGLQSVKGPGSPILAKGHISTMPRVHEQGVYAPTYSFAFTVETMMDGLYQDTVSSGSQLTTWAAIMAVQLENSGQTTSAGTNASIYTESDSPIIIGVSSPAAINQAYQAQAIANA
jgi:hypothetical protein